MSLITSFVARCLHCGKAALINVCFGQSLACGCRRRDPTGRADNCTGFHCAPETSLEDRTRSCQQVPWSCSRFSNLSSNPRFISHWKHKAHTEIRLKAQRSPFSGQSGQEHKAQTLRFQTGFNTEKKFKLFRNCSSFSISFCASPFSITPLQTHRSTKSLQIFHLSPLISDINY